MTSRPILSAILAVAVVSTFIAAALAAPMRLKPCDARTVAEFASMELGQYLEVVDYAEHVGGITAEHAENLRQLAMEVRSVPNPEAWAKAKCAEAGA